MAQLRDFGLKRVGRLPWGAHACAFHRDLDELLDVLVPYLRAGLEGNEYCLWLTTPVLEPRVTGALRSAVPDLEARTRRGQIHWMHDDEWYVEGAAFDTAGIIERLQSRLKEALSLGYEGMRIASSTPWLDHIGWKDVADLRMMALCTFDLSQCGASSVIDVLVGHPYALVKSHGLWQLVGSAGLPRPLRVPQESEQRLRLLLEQTTKLVRSGTHDVRTPLAAIAMAAQATRKRPECQVAARALDTIIRNCERVDAMLSELATAGRLDFVGLDPQPQLVECAEFITELLARLDEKVDIRRLQVVLVEGLPPVQVDPKHLAQILETALVIVLESSAPDAQAVLEATAADDWVEIAVVGQGTAVQAVEASRDSRTYELRPGPSGSKGSGSDGLARQARTLSLLWMRTLVEANQGAMRIETAPVPCFRLQLGRAAHATGSALATQLAQGPVPHR